MDLLFERTGGGQYRYIKIIFTDNTSIQIFYPDCVKSN